MHIRTRPGRVIARLASVVVIALLVASCGGGASSGIRISDPWSRNAAKTAGAGAAYMIIENTGSSPDALIGGKSDVAKAVEVHETYEMAPEAAPSDGMGGSMMGMRRIDKLEIPAGGKVELKPGGYHIMLIDLTGELKAGEKIEITLTFEKAGEVKITAEVRAQ